VSVPEGPTLTVLDEWLHAGATEIGLLTTLIGWAPEPIAIKAPYFAIHAVSTASAVEPTLGEEIIDAFVMNAMPNQWSSKPGEVPPIFSQRAKAAEDLHRTWSGLPGSDVLSQIGAPTTEWPRSRRGRHRSLALAREYTAGNDTRAKCVDPACTPHRRDEANDGPGSVSPRFVQPPIPIVGQSGQRSLDQTPLGPAGHKAGRTGLAFARVIVTSSFLMIGAGRTCGCCRIAASIRPCSPASA
jgi:hypothetical protein